MHVEPWIILTHSNPNTCTSGDIVAFTWQTSHPAEIIKDSTVGALVVEFHRLQGENAVYRYNSINKEVYAELRRTARNSDTSVFKNMFNQEVRNHSRGADYERRSQA